LIKKKGKKINLAFFGDSICFGQHISVHRSWVALISRSLELMGKHKGVQINVTNDSINGNTTRLALERMPYEIQSNNFDIIFIQFGMNDCNYWKTDNGLPRVSKKAFAANLEEIIDRAVACGIKSIFLATNHPTALFKSMPSSGVLYQKSNKEYNEIVRQVATARKGMVELIDNEKNVLQYLAKKKMAVRDIVLPDLIHLNDLGHKIYYQKIMPKIKTVIMDLLK